jgi:BASS family bile acid:Na+ symporter
VVLMAMPLIAAMIVGSRAARLAAICRPILTVVANLSVVVVLVLFVGLNLKALWDVVGSGAIAVAAVFAALAYMAGVVMAGPQSENKAAMGLASSTRNVAAALPIASLGGDPKVIIMLLVGTLTSLIVTLAAIRIRRRRGNENAHHQGLPINPQVARK